MYRFFSIGVRNSRAFFVDMQDLLDDEAVLDAIDEENEFQALVVSFILPGLLWQKRFLYC